MCRSNADVWHFKRTVATHILRISLCIRLSFNLDTTCPVILCNGRIAFHNIAIGINTAIYFMIQFASSRFGFQDAMPHRSIFRSGRSRFIIAICQIEFRILATIASETAFTPIVINIIAYIKISAIVIVSLMFPVPKDSEIRGQRLPWCANRIWWKEALSPLNIAP